MIISGVSGEGVPDLLRAAYRAVKRHRDAETAAAAGEATAEPAGWSPV